MGRRETIVVSHGAVCFPKFCRPYFRTIKPIARRVRLVGEMGG